MAHRSITFSPELAEKIVKRVKMAGSYTRAARAFGIPPGTLAMWLKRFPDFRQQCERARLEAESVFYN